MKSKVVETTKPKFPWVDLIGLIACSAVGTRGDSDINDVFSKFGAFVIVLDVLAAILLVFGVVSLIQASRSANVENAKKRHSVASEAISTAIALVLYAHVCYPLVVIQQNPFIVIAGAFGSAFMVRGVVWIGEKVGDKRAEKR